MKNKRKWTTAAIILLLTGGVVLSIIMVNKNATAIARDRAYEVLYDSANEQASTLNTSLDGQFQALEMLSIGLASQESADEAEIIALIREAADVSSFSSIRFLRTDGTDLRDDSINVSDKDYFITAKNGSRGISHIAKLPNGEMGLALTVPYKKAGQVRGVLLGLYYQQPLRDLMLSSAYGGEGYSFVADSEGNVIIGSDSDFYLIKDENLFDFYTDAAFEQDFTEKKLSQMLQNGEWGSFSYSCYGERRTAAFIPVRTKYAMASDWFLFNVVPESGLQAEIEKERRNVWELSMVLLLFAGVGIAIFLFQERMRHKEIKQEAAHAHMREERFAMVLRATGTLVFVFDTETNTYETDPRASEYIAGKFDGRPIHTILEEDGLVADAAEVNNALTVLNKAVRGNSPYEDVILRLKIPTGEFHWFRIQAIRFEDEGASKVLLTANDVNARKTAEDSLRYRAERDLLTGLYNRTTFYELAAEMVAAHEPGYYVLACFDIDKFKVVNDQYGHETGDQVLRNVGETAKEMFASIGGICCRVYADNFAAIYPNTPENNALVVQIREQKSKKNSTGQYLNVSVGRNVIDDTALPISVVHDRAAIAKASVKGQYGLNVAYYSNDMRESILREQEVTRQMGEALEQKQFEVWYQPQYDLSNDALIGAEALVRWRHPEKGLIPPGVFIPIFERNGFVYTLDKFVWEQVCIQQRQWLDAGRQPLPVSVNVSRHDVYHDDFYAFMTGLVERYSLPVDLLRLEITESAFAESSGRIVNMVKRLRAFGFLIEIDDFGSGYSSLNTLKDVPADILKLDMRFLSGGENEQRSGSIVSSVIHMAQRLQMPVIAEGVETKPQAAFLTSVGCAFVQGYLYARPMPVGEYEAVCESNKTE